MRQSCHYVQRWSSVNVQDTPRGSRLIANVRCFLQGEVCARMFLGVLIVASAAWLGAAEPSGGRPATAGLAGEQRRFLEQHCYECHDADLAKGGLDLASMAFDPDDRRSAARWALVHDRVRDGEMPPAKKPRPDRLATGVFLDAIAIPLMAADQTREAREGRAVWRRLNRSEYENSLRDLFAAPWLQVKDLLPEDGEAHRFNKSGDALDYSHVQMAQYLAAARHAIHEVMAADLAAPPSTTVRYHAREQPDFVKRMTRGSAERGTFPVLGTSGQPLVRSGEQPLTVGASQPELREQEAMAVISGSFNPLYLHFDRFAAPVSGRYRLRLLAYAIWVGPGPDHRWWKPDQDVVAPGRRPEPVTLYAEHARLMRKLGSVDVGSEPAVHELEVLLLAGETIRPDAARLYRPRPPTWRNPLAEKTGQPGVAYRWLEVEGPLPGPRPSMAERLLFADLPLQRSASSGRLEAVSAAPGADAELLVRRFLTQAYRRPITDDDVAPFTALIARARAAGATFTEALIAGYCAILCSPAFITLEEHPGALDGHARAARLSYALWNSTPDDDLRVAAARGDLSRPGLLRHHTERLLNDVRGQRFIDAFLDYWLDLRRLGDSAPDAALYPDYYLDDLLVESAGDETRLFFADLVRRNLPARTLVSCDFTYLNERLAVHYGIPDVQGVAMRQVRLPQDSPRGGLLTQASVLKVTANGTTTSPILRGVWIMERLLGQVSPPPPASVPAVEPDTRGATTIREQLAKHRTASECASCHVKIDPVGFALESFDVMGGYRERYRAVAEPAETKTSPARIPGYGKNGQPFAFHLGQPVDPSGVLPDGRTFTDVQQVKRLLLADERAIARNLVQHLVVYATGAAVRFGDRPRVERILDRAAADGYGIRTLIHEVIQSELFLHK